MLQLTRLSGPKFALNPDLIERAEATPDTVVTLVNGSKYVVRETLDEFIALVHEYRAGLLRATSANNANASNAPRRAASLAAVEDHPAGETNVVTLHAAPAPANLHGEA